MNSNKWTRPLSVMSRGSLLLVAMGISAAVSASALSYDSNVGFQNSASCNSGNAFAIDNSDVTLNNGSPVNATECFGAYQGNNSTAPLTWNSMSWSHIAKLDISEGGGSQQTGQQITVDFGGNVDEDGTWSYGGNFSDWGSFFLVTKAANNPGWAAYYFDDLDGLNSLGGSFTIPWTVGNPDKDNNPALSHLSLYAKNIARVPEPGTLGLMGLGLLALGLRRTRK